MAKKHTKKTFRQIAEAKVTVFDDAVVKTVHEVEATEVKTVKNTRKYWNVLGPGLTTGASDDDPSGIATYSQTGAQYGYQLLWMSIVTFPLMGIVQEWPREGAPPAHPSRRFIMKGTGRCVTLSSALWQWQP